MELSYSFMIFPLLLFAKLNLLNFCGYLLAYLMASHQVNDDKFIFAVSDNEF